MKKIIFSFLTIFVIGVNAFAVDFSIGATLGGWGPTFGRGKEYKDSTSGDTKAAGIPYSMAFAQVADVRAFVDIIPYFGIEAGVGYAMKSLATKYEVGSDKYVGQFNLNQISIPIFFKGQYEIANMVNVYLGVGPKFNINLGGNITSYLNDKKVGDEVKLEKEVYNAFDMDLTIALGAEYKIAEVHYLGLRVGYDINLLGSFKTQNEDGKYETSKYYIDDLAIALSYRYKFAK